MAVSIAGRRMYMRRAVDSEGEVLDVLVQPRRVKAAASAQRFVSAHSAVYNVFNVQRHLISRATLHRFRAAAHRARNEASAMT